MNAEFFKNNRLRLRELFAGAAPIVLTANGALQRSVDSPFPFKQDGSFWYLTGISLPDIILVLDKSKEYLIIPELSRARQAFDGAIDIAALKNISGVEEALVEKEGWERLDSRLKKARNVAVLAPAPAYIEPLGIYTNPARRRLVRRIKQINPKITFLDLRAHLRQMRTIKQAEELKAIEKAVAITCESLKIIHAKFKKNNYDNEFDVELDLGREFMKRGAEGHSFAPIVAAAARGSQLHPVNNRGPIKARDSLLMDVGAEYNNYAADLTRTWSNHASKRLQAVHASVLSVQDYAFSIIKPGILLRDYEKLVEKYMGEKLKELGLIKTIDHDSVRKYYPHGTSHFLGVDVHDAGDTQRPLEPGVVLTVEPGIYIPEEGIGVRIEDDMVITGRGRKILSADLPRTLA